MTMPAVSVYEESAWLLILVIPADITTGTGSALFDAPSTTQVLRCHEDMLYIRSLTTFIAGV